MNIQKSLFQRHNRLLGGKPFFAWAIPRREKQSVTGEIKNPGLKTILGLSALLCLFKVTSAQAFVNTGSLDVILAPFPDIFVEQVDVDFTAVSGDFTATGIAQNLKLPVGTDTIDSGMFSLIATINDIGEATAGTLTINGTTSGSNTFLGSPLLTAELTGFSSEFGTGASEQLQFLFSNLSGSGANLYGGNTATAGVVVNSSGYQGNFTSDFGDTPIFGVGGANVDVAPQSIPEPGSLMLTLAGGLFFCAWRSRRVR